MATAGGPSDQSALFAGLWWLGGAVVVAMAAALILTLLRKRLLGSHTVNADEMTLAQFRELRDRGCLSVSEFELLRAKLLSSDGRDRRGS